MRVNSKKSQKHQTLLGVRIDSTNESQVLAQVRDFLLKKEKFTVFTPNPEIVLKAYQDPEFKKTLNLGTILIPDGVGIKLAGKLYGENLEIIRGRELFIKLLKLTAELNLKIFLLGPSDEVVDLCLKRISDTYPSVKARGIGAATYNDRIEAIDEKNAKLHQKCLTEIETFRPDLLFVALGAPKQERFLINFIRKLPITGGLGIGGALDYYAGKASLPPRFVANLGLEWLWRLTKEPSRLPRIVNALIIFPIFVLKERLMRVFDRVS